MYTGSNPNNALFTIGEFLRGGPSAAANVGKLDSFNIDVADIASKAVGASQPGASSSPPPEGGYGSFAGVPLSREEWLDYAYRELSHSRAVDLDNTAIARRAQDAINAGINPAAVFGAQGAGTPSAQGFSAREQEAEPNWLDVLLSVMGIVIPSFSRVISSAMMANSIDRSQPFGRDNRRR